MEQDKQQKLIELLGDFSTAMLVTRKTETGVHIRPMRIAKLTEDGRLYFITSKQSPKSAEISVDASVDVVFQDDSKFVTMTGNATITDDRKLLDDLWSEPYKVWFPKGKDDPNICIIQVEPAQAEYWDNEGMQGLSYAFAAAKAYLKGETPKVDQDVHGKLNVR
jgi:general stress protein 26